MSLLRALPYGIRRTRLAPLLIPILFRLVAVAAVLSGLALLTAALWFSWWLGLIALVVLPAATVGAIMAARVAAELALAVFAMADDLEGIAERMPRLESTMHGVAADMPPLGFLRRAR